MLRRMILAVAGVALATAARAEQRDFCPDRPSRATPPCTLSPGVAEIEASLLDYSHSRDSDLIEDQFITGDLLMRYGIAEHAEFRVGWTAYGFDRTLDRHSGAVARGSSTGDVTLSVRRNLLNPSGAPTSLAVQPFVTLPTGGDAIGAGAWGAGLLAPFAAQLGGGWGFAADPELDASPNTNRRGRHLAYSLVTGVSHGIGQHIGIGVEAYAQRNLDPAGHQTLASLDADAACQLPGGNSQVDIQANAGLTSATPRIEIILGFAVRL